MTIDITNVLDLGIASMVNVYNPEYDLLIAASVLAVLPPLPTSVHRRHDRDWAARREIKDIPC